MQVTSSGAIKIGLGSSLRALAAVPAKVERRDGGIGIVAPVAIAELVGRGTGRSSLPPRSLLGVARRSRRIVGRCGGGRRLLHASRRPSLGSLGLGRRGRLGPRRLQHLLAGHLARLHVVLVRGRRKTARRRGFRAEEQGQGPNGQLREHRASRRGGCVSAVARRVSALVAASVAAVGVRAATARALRRGLAQVRTRADPVDDG